MSICLSDEEASRIFCIEYGDFLTRDYDFLTWEADDSLYKVFSRIERIAEDDDITTLWLVEAVRYLIDDEILTVLECRIHRSTIYDKWLSDEGAYWDDDDESGHDIAESLSHEAFLWSGGRERYFHRV
jgi:hypothetical protein